MELKNVALLSTLTILLITKSVESSGREEPKSSPFLAPLVQHDEPIKNPQQVRDRHALLPEGQNRKRKAEQHLSKPLTEQETSLASVSKEDPIVNSPRVQSFIKAIHSGDMDAALTLFYGGNSELKNYCGKYLVGLGSLGLSK